MRMFFFLCHFLLFLSTDAVAQDFDPDLLFEPPSRSQYLLNRSENACRANNFNSGFLTTDILNADTIRSLILLGDGKLLAGGSSNNGANDDFTLVRYLPDGPLDTTFATSGILIDATGTGSDLIHSLLVQTDGNAIAIGRGLFHNYDFALARYTSSGRLDTTFHTDGKVITSVRDNADVGRAGALQTDGKILASGYSWWMGQYNFAVARYNTDGSIDTSFNYDGTTLQVMSASDNGALSIVVQTDGGVILGGTSNNGGNWDFAICRLNTNGVLDTTFSSDGKQVTAILAGDEKANSLRVTTAGEILLAGYTASGGADALDNALVRYQSNGTLDTAFHTDGMLTHPVTTNNDDVINAIIFDSGGALTAAGYSYNGSNNDFSVSRYMSNGTFDTVFETDGKLTSAIGGAEDTAVTAAISSTGQLFLAGKSNNGSNLDFAISRYGTSGTVTQAGALDQSFGNAGLVSTDLGGTDSPRAAILQTDGKIVVLGNAGSDFSFVRYLEAGSIDTAFSTDGKFSIDVSGTDNPFGVTLQSDGKIIGVGYDGTTDVAVVRLTTDGKLDTTFLTDGVIQTHVAGNDQAKAVLVTTEGNVMAFGYATNVDQDFLAIRYLSDGVLDTTFSTRGYMTNDYTTGDIFYAALIDSQGRIMGGGSVGACNTIHRLISDGTFDTSFTTAGIWTGCSGANAAAIGSLLYKPTDNTFAMSSSVGSGNIIFRVHSNGTLDTTFSNNGISNTPPSVTVRTAVYSNQTLYSAAVVSSQFGLMKYLSNGTIDTSFNTDGIVTADFSGGSDTPTIVLAKPDGRICIVGTAAATDYGVSCFQP